jgi:hypothetical protein
MRIDRSLFNFDFLSLLYSLHFWFCQPILTPGMGRVGSRSPQPPSYPSSSSSALRAMPAAHHVRHYPFDNLLRASFPCSYLPDTIHHMPTPNGFRVLL